MQIVPMTGTLIDRHNEENAQAIAESSRAAIDYNIMMGILEDPNEEEESEDE